MDLGEERLMRVCLLHEVVSQLKDPNSILNWLPPHVFFQDLEPVGKLLLGVGGYGRQHLATELMGQHALLGHRGLSESLHIE